MVLDMGLIPASDLGRGRLNKLNMENQQAGRLLQQSEHRFERVRRIRARDFERAGERKRQQLGIRQFGQRRGDLLTRGYPLDNNEPIICRESSIRKYEIRHAHDQSRTKR